MSVSGVNPGMPTNPNMGPNRADNSSLEMAKNVISDAAEVIDNEVMGLSARDVKGGKTAVQEGVQNQAQNTEQGSNIAQQAELAAEIKKYQKTRKKKRKGKKGLEETFEELEQLEEIVDENQVQAEEKGMIREFFDNLARIKNLRQRLKQLKQEEKFLKQAQEEEERRKKQEERDQQHQQKQQQQNQQEEQEEDTSEPEPEN